MRKILRGLVTLLVASAIPVTLLVALPAPAQAATKKITRTYTIPLSHYQFSTVAARARIDAMNNPGTVLNYAKLIKAFHAVINRNETSWRRQFAAGALVAKNVRITNIGSAERKAINATVRKYFNSSCPQCRIFKDQSAQRGPGTNCTGRSALVVHKVTSTNRKASTTYLDSCETNNWKFVYKVAGIMIGGIAALIALTGNVPIATLVGLLAGSSGIKMEHIALLQSNSRYNAVYFTSSDVRTIEDPNGNARRLENIAWYSQ